MDWKKISVSLIVFSVGVLSIFFWLSSNYSFVEEINKLTFNQGHILSKISADKENLNLYNCYEQLKFYETQKLKILEGVDTFKFNIRDLDSALYFSKENIADYDSVFSLIEIEMYDEVEGFIDVTCENDIKRNQKILKIIESI
jgi:hypothetical protein